MAIGVEALAAVDEGAADRPLVGAGVEPEDLVVRDARAAGLQVEQLALQVGRKVRLLALWLRRAGLGEHRAAVYRASRLDRNYEDAAHAARQASAIAWPSKRAA